MEEPRALPLPHTGKGGPTKELCNHGSAFGAASSPHSVCPGDDGASNQSDMSWKEMMKEGEGMKVQNSHLLGSQPCPG